MNKNNLTQQLKDLFTAMDPKNVNNIDDWLVVDYDNEFDAHIADNNRRHTPAVSRAMFRDDPLALSCASYRIYKAEPIRRFVNIDTVKATSEDRVHAQAIRDYYSARYTMKVLRGGKLTEWQQKAASFLSGQYHLTTEELGMLYKLPYFYEEDLATDDIVSETVSCQSSDQRVVEEENLTLIPLKRVLVTRKGASDFVYYYYLDQDQHAVLLMCPATNALNSMMEGLFRQRQIRVKGHVFFKDIGENSQHFIKKLGRWELVF